MFAGLLSLSPDCPLEARVDREAWRAALSPFHAPDREGFWQSGPACLAERRVFNAPANRDERLPLVCPDTGVALAFWGRLDNRGSLATALGIAGARLAAMTDGQLVLEGWRHWGDALPHHLLGDFALAAMDPVGRRAFLARDPLGVKPLYYLLNAQCLAFATSVAALRVLRATPLTPDTDWMARYLLRLSMSDRQTGYREVLKLPPGHCLIVSADGREQLRRWHRWRDDPPPATRRDPRWVDAYRAVLEESIRCRMDSDYPLGTENSGGLDSATITAYLAHFMGEPNDRLHSFGLAFCAREPAFILETSQAKRIAHNYILTAWPDGDTGEWLDRVLKVLGYPEEHGSGSSHTHFYRECTLRGIRTLFSGFGGDEVATNPGDHLRWELLDRHHYRALWDILPGNPVMRSLRLGKAALLGRRHPTCNPALLAVQNARWPHHPLRAEVVQRLGLDIDYMETVRDNAPYRRINDVILRQLLTMPYIATRLENCTLMAAAYGIDYRWPLWDVRLVQQYLSTPSIEKMGPKGIGRYLHRCAVDGVVPRRVAWKPHKDMGPSQPIQAMNGTRPARMTAQANTLANNLHPVLDTLVDRAKLQEQIRTATTCNPRDGSVSGLARTISALHWLNHWLRGSET